MRPRILLLRALGLGDFLTGVPAYRAVRRAFPDHELILAAPGELAGLAALDGSLDRLLPTPGLGPIAWRHQPPEVAVNLHGTGADSHLILERLNPGRLITYHSDPLPDWSEDHERRRWCRLLEHAGIPADPDDFELTAPPRPQLPYTIVHPGAAFPARRWPAERFAAVARWLHHHGHRLRITGTGAETALARQVAERAGLPREASIAGRTALTDLAGIIATARLVISGDTGIAHLATAYRRPSVVLFGPIPPAQWGPPYRPYHAALWPADLDYRGNPHGMSVDPALERITISDVLGAIELVLSNQPSGSAQNTPPGAKQAV
ncbi:MAG: glycosyltransferase family 9 protein [Catenulisporales bacterium]|nr:glycosyltransferase family 9 protein [Catenulisporales bacterium]